MALMKKTQRGTIFANTYELRRGEMGIFCGIYDSDNLICIECSDGTIKLLINDFGMENLDVQIIHTDSKWNPIND